jgi:hypothetical protein
LLFYGVSSTGSLLTLPRIGMQHGMACKYPALRRVAQDHHLLIGLYLGKFVQKKFENISANKSVAYWQLLFDEKNQMSKIL